MRWRRFFATQNEDVLGMTCTHGRIQLVGIKAHREWGRSVASKAGDQISNFKP
jgi:hypothetical protein